MGDRNPLSSWTLLAAPHIPGLRTGHHMYPCLQTPMAKKNYFYFSVHLRKYHLDKLSSVAGNANSPIFHFIGEIATDRIHLPGEYGLREPYSTELQGNSRTKELQSWQATKDKHKNFSDLVPKEN